MRCSGLRRGSWLRSAGSPLGEGVAAGSSGADAEACSDRLVGVPCLTHALGGLLLGFRQPENEDDGEEEDDRPPGEKASHGCKSCVVTTGACAALSTSEV